MNEKRIKEEEDKIKKQEEFAKTPYSRFIGTTNIYADELAKKLLVDKLFLSGTQWPKLKVGSTLRIKLPSSK